MNKKLLISLAAVAVVGVASLAWAQNSACNILNCMEQGGSRWSVGGSVDILSGGDLDIESGGALKIAGSDITTELGLLDGVTASTADLNATTNFEETISASTTVVTITDGTIDIDVASHDGSNGLKLGGTLVTATAAELNYNDITTLGTVEASKAITADANKRIIWTTTSSTTVNPISFTSTMTGAGTTGGRALFQLNANAALGGWSNALKGITVYNASGSTSGLGSAVLAELQLSTGTTTGTYAPLESEIVVGTSGVLGTATSFLYMNVVDDGTTFNDDGYLLELGAGVVATSGGLFDTIAEATVASTHSLKVRIGGTTYYIPLNTSQAF